MTQIVPIAAYSSDMISSADQLQGYTPQVGFIVRPVIRPDQFHSTAPKSQKNVLPGLLSFIVPGGGQYLNGETHKGIAHFCSAVVTHLAAGLSANHFFNMIRENTEAEEALKSVSKTTSEISKELPHSSGKVAGVGILAILACLSLVGVRLFSAKDAYDGKKTAS